MFDERGLLGLRLDIQKERVDKSCSALGEWLAFPVPLENNVMRVAATTMANAKLRETQIQIWALSVRLESLRNAIEQRDWEEVDNEYEDLREALTAFCTQLQSLD